jgi:hypothetical protein
MDDLWYEEELAPPPEELERISRGEHGQREDLLPHLKVRVGQVRWKLLGEVPLRVQKPGFLYLVRLRFQFVTHRAEIVYARCATRLWSARRGTELPVVYDLYPRNLYEGKPRTIEIKLGPELRIGALEVTTGSIASEVIVGQVQPVVVGYLGEEEATPYWEVYPKRGERGLEGVLDFWLAVETPVDCPRFALAVMAEGTAQTKRRFLVRPKEQAWDVRPRVTIG